MSYLFRPDPHPSAKTTDDGSHLSFTICVSGAADGDTVDQSADLAELLGKSIAKHGHILTTGATVGLPSYVAKGAKLAGGMSIGFSPASSLREHLKKYRLPFEYFDFINFTGMQYVGRDLYLVQSSDALITVGGRFGSLHEFISGLEAGKPCGVLMGSGGAADIIPELMKSLSPPKKSLVIFDTDPNSLVSKIEDVLEEQYSDIYEAYNKNISFGRSKQAGG